MKLLLVLLVVATVFSGITFVKIKTEVHHTCEAPCTVVFPADMEEDELRFDYTSDREFKVWRNG